MTTAACHMPKKKSNIRKCNQGEKSLRIPYNIYADTGSLLEKISSDEKDPEI